MVFFEGSHLTPPTILAKLATANSLQHMPCRNQIQILFFSLLSNISIHEENGIHQTSTQTPVQDVMDTFRICYWQIYANLAATFKMKGLVNTAWPFSFNTSPLSEQKHKKTQPTNTLAHLNKVYHTGGRLQVQKGSVHVKHAINTCLLSSKQTTVFTGR